MLVVSGQSGIILVHFMLEKLEGEIQQWTIHRQHWVQDTERKQTKQKKV